MFALQIDTIDTYSTVACSPGRLQLWIATPTVVTWSRRSDLSDFTTKWSCPCHPAAWTCQNDTAYMRYMKPGCRCAPSPMQWRVRPAR
ncbi:hypothetical protein BXO25_00570, partial [Xanthomonas oryzae pv. oryzae]